MDRVDAEQLDRPVQSAVEREIGHLGVNGVAISVVDGDDQEILLRQGGRQLDAPGAVAAVMAAQAPAIQIDGRRGVGPLQLQVAAAGVRQARAGEGLGVVAGAPVVVVAAVLAVQGIPGVRQVDQRPGLGHLRRRYVRLPGKGPAFLQGNDLAHGDSSLKSVK